MELEKRNMYGNGRGYDFTVKKYDESMIDMVFSEKLSSANRVDLCLSLSEKENSNSLSELLKKLILNTSSKGQQRRIVTGISNENMRLAKKMLTNSEVFHLDNSIDCFAIFDQLEYFCEIGKDTQGLQSYFILIFSTNKQFVQIQSLLFENLLKNAELATKRIRELERLTEKEFSLKCSDYHDAFSHLTHQIKNAAFEILLLFSTLESFLLFEQSGIMEYLNDAKERGVKVRAMIKLGDEENKTQLGYNLKKKYEGINITFIMQPLRSKVTSIIIDQTYSFVFESKDVHVNNDSIQDKVGLLTFSNNELTVITYHSLFENMWIQSEIEKNNRNRQAYFQLFKGVNIRDEVYDRKWNSEEYSDNKDR